MLTATEKSVEQGQVRELIYAWAEAARNKDIDGLMSFYSEDLIAFDMMAPLQFAGKDAYRDSWQMGFDMSETIEIEASDLKIEAGQETAYCHRLSRMSGVSRDGERYDFWTRWTSCLRKEEGKWLITHEHNSVPFDMESGKALMDLKPNE